MMFPLAYKYKCFYLDEYVYGYLIRANSHSHEAGGYEKTIKRLNGYVECVHATLDNIGAKEKYKGIFESFIRRCKYVSAWTYKNKNDLKVFKSDLQKHKEYNIFYSLMSVFPYNNCTKILIKLLNKFYKIKVK